MTSRAVMTGEERLLHDRANRAQGEMRKLDAQRRRDGIRAHLPDPLDPWGETVWRQCQPGCPTHGGPA